MSSPKRTRANPAIAPKKRPGPVGGKRDRNRRENIERLNEVALQLFLAKGIEAVTIDEIVDAAGMAKGSFYRYARDKADVVARIMAPVVAEVTEVLDRCDQALQHARSETLVAVYLQLALELSRVLSRHAPRVLFYLQEMRAPRGSATREIQALADLLATRAIALTLTAHRHQLIRDVDPEVTALAVLGAIDAILFAHLRRRRAARDIPATITELVTIVVNGVRR